MGVLTILAIVLQLVFLEATMSLDNILVLSALASRLPKLPTPLPKSLVGIPFLNRFLGRQRQSALRIGLLGAYLGEGLMLLLITTIVRYPIIKIVGALYLLQLSVRHLYQLAGRPDLHRRQARAKLQRSPLNHIQSKFWPTVIAIELSDLAFSLDNLIAVVAITNRFLLAFSGVAIGIFLMRLAAGRIISLIDHWPSLVWGAYFLILAVAGELLLGVLFHLYISDIHKLFISMIIVVFCLSVQVLSPTIFKAGQ